MPNTTQPQIIFIQIEEDTKTHTFSADFNARITLSHLPADEDKQDFYETLSETTLMESINNPDKVVTHIIGQADDVFNDTNLHNSIYLRTYNNGHSETNTFYLLRELINANLTLDTIAHMTSNDL